MHVEDREMSDLCVRALQLQSYLHVSRSNAHQTLWVLLLSRHVFDWAVRLVSKTILLHCTEEDKSSQWQNP